MSAEIQPGSRPAAAVASVDVSDAKRDKIALKRRFLEIVTPIMNLEIPDNEKNKYKIVRLPPKEKEALAAEIAKWRFKTEET